MSGSVYLKVPEADIEVSLLKPDGKEEKAKFLFVKHFVSGILTNDPSFFSDYKGAIAAAEIDRAYARVKPGCFVELSHDQYTRLKRALENPAKPFPPVLKQAVEYIFAIMNPVSEEEMQEELHLRSNRQDNSVPS